MPGILEVVAVEYYANEMEDDIENGIVGGLIAEPINPNTKEQEYRIIGETFIKPKKVYEYYINNIQQGNWYVDTNIPINYTTSINTEGYNTISIKWTQSYSGQFDIWFGEKDKNKAKYKKTIVVESLF